MRMGRGRQQWEDWQLYLNSRGRDAGRCGISPRDCCSCVNVNLKIALLNHFSISPFSSSCSVRKKDCAESKS